MTDYTFHFEDFAQEVNPSFMPLFLNKEREHIEYGGAGSGKSYSIAQKHIVRLLNANKRGITHKFLCLRKTQPAARKSLFALFLEVIDKWNIGSLCKPNKTDMTITVCGNQIIYITGMDDPEKIKSIQGISSIWMEEATEFTYDDYRQLKLRMRGDYGDYKQLLMSFNPIDENHWIKTEIIDKTNISIHHSTYKDNPLGLKNDPEYGQELEKLMDMDQNYYNIYALGKWGVLKGRIYDNWIIVSELPTDTDMFAYGLDFGYSSDPAALVEVGIKGKSLYLEEHIYETGLTNQDLAARIKHLVIPNPYSRTIADSAEPKSIEELVREGLYVSPSIKGKDSVNNGIQRMKQFTVYVKDTSVNLIKEYETYKWKDDKNHTGKFLPQPVKFMDHCLDAARYALVGMVGFAQPDLSMGGDPNQDKKDRMSADDYDPVWEDDMWEDV